MPLIPLLLGAASAVPDLLDAARRAYEAVTGAATPPTTTADQLGAAVNALPADQAARWAQLVQADLDRYRAETDRLAGDQGAVTADVLATLPPAAAAEVAVLRMTTRPRVVLRMAHVLLLPVYLIAIDGAALIVNAVLAALGLTTRIAPIAGQMFAQGSVYADLYGQATGPAAAVVITYMLAREVGKLAGGGDAGGAIDGVVAAVGKIAGLVRRK